MLANSRQETMSDTIACTLFNLLASEDELARSARRLSPQETARATRIVRAAQRRRYVVARSGLRVLLAQALGQEARDVPLADDEYGKPILTGPAQGRLAFNMSHSGDFALIAIGTPSAIGVDLELIAPPRAGVAKNFFSAAENEALAALSGAALAAGFTRLWTRKEAVIKAVGLGLRLPLDTFDAPVEPAARTRLMACRFDPSLVERLVLLDCPVQEGWFACVAALDAPARPVLSVRTVLRAACVFG